MCLLLCQYHTVSITIALYCNLKLGVVILSALLLFFGNFFKIYSGVFVFPYEAANRPFKICEELCWTLDGDCSGSLDCLGSMAVFTLSSYQFMRMRDLSTF